MCSPDIPQPYIYNKVKTTNANIKRYKEQVMTRGTKKDDDRPHGRHAYGSGREFIKQNFY